MLISVYYTLSTSHMSCRYQLVLANDNNNKCCQLECETLNGIPWNSNFGAKGKEPLGSSCLATVAGTNLIGPVKHDREMVHPVTFSFPGCFLLALYRRDT